MIKLRNSSIQPARIQISIAPMIGVVFLLLFFDLLNLKIVSSQSSFANHLPIRGPAPDLIPHHHTEIKVGLRSDRHGNLTQVTLGSNELGNDDMAFERLNREILRLIGRTGSPLTNDIEVEIDADYETQYKYVVKAISECTGQYDPDSRQVARYVEKIKFAPPHKPKG